MGGFTTIQLKDASQENVDVVNDRLRAYKTPRKYWFYSENDVKKEYQYYLKKDGNYPEHLFPVNKIKSYGDFKKYWNPKALGECFVPQNGMLVFDCYFGRTSKNALRSLGRFFVENHDLISKVSGSFSTFAERGMTKIERKFVEERTTFGKDIRSITLWI